MTEHSDRGPLLLNFKLPEMSLRAESDLDDEDRFLFGRGDEEMVVHAISFNEESIFLRGLTPTPGPTGRHLPRVAGFTWTDDGWVAYRPPRGDRGAGSYDPAEIPDWVDDAAITYRDLLDEVYAEAYRALLRKAYAAGLVLIEGNEP